MLKELATPFLTHKYLLFQLTQRSIKARYKQSIIGYAWVLINPLAQLLVYTFVFSVIFKFPTNNIPYPVFLFAGLLPWIYMQNVLASATTSLVDNADLIRKVYFPREILIYSVVLSKTVDFVFALSLLFIFMVVYHIPIGLTTLYIIPLFIIQIILMSGLSLFFSTFNLFYRDIQYLVTLLLLLWTYLTPVVYALSLVPEKYISIYKLNPMVGIIEGYRSALFNLAFDTGTICWSLIISVFIFVISYIFFKKSEKVFADIV
ncbi:MAG: ABC transporter permease [Candidatus Daviesbacteria bacterium]|nr:ABC transporter permease [Candidatus Daviesbacteria bacterium]